MRVGVLAAQGDFAEHIAVLNQLGAEACPVRLPGEIAGLDGLIIPGGESTSISKLMGDYNLIEPIKKRAGEGMAIFGTCAGMIVMSRDLSDPKVQTLELMDIKVSRNAFGRQVDSFEADLNIPEIGSSPFHAVFIRAPLVERINNGAHIIARLENGSIVAVRQKKFLACAFHPELTEDYRIHRYFLDMVAGTR